MRKLVLALFWFPLSLSAQERPAVQPEDYGRWESPGAATLSPDGRWLAYAVNRVNEENELRIRDLSGNRERVAVRHVGLDCPVLPRVSHHHALSGLSIHSAGASPA